MTLQKLTTNVCYRYFILHVLGYASYRNLLNKNDSPCTDVQLCYWCGTVIKLSP